MFLVCELDMEINCRFYRELKDSSDGSAFTLYLACISSISTMVAKFKQAILHFQCGLVKIYQTF